MARQSRAACAVLLCFVTAALLSACDDGKQATDLPLPINMPTSMAKATPIQKPTVIPIPEPTATPTPEPTSTPPPTATPTPEPTSTPPPTATPTRLHPHDRYANTGAYPHASSDRYANTGAYPHALRPLRQHRSLPPRLLRPLRQHRSLPPRLPRLPSCPWSGLLPFPQPILSRIYHMSLSLAAIPFVCHRQRRR